MNSVDNYGIYRKLEWEQVKDDILKLANPENVTRSYLSELFSRGVQSQDEDGNIIMSPAKYNVTDYFDLPANILINQPKAVPDTTIGVFIFNAFILANAFGNKFPYMNVAMGKDNFGKLNSDIGLMIMEGKISVDEFAVYQNTVCWMGYNTEIFTPGVSEALIVPNAEVKKLKAELLKEHPEFLKNEVIDNNVIANYKKYIEDPLVKKAKEELGKDPSFRLYEVKKPNFGNNYKNSVIENGPMMDLTTGKFRINNNAFNDGITPENFDLIANKALYASYSRGVNTAKGGTFAKYTNGMMQTVTLDVKGSDCGSHGYLTYEVDKDNWRSILFRYALINGKETRLTSEILQQLIGKTIKMRTPLYCKGKKSVCNKCAGDSFYIMNIKNIGLTSSIPMNASLNKSMKKMHDLTIKTYPANMKKFIQFDS